jgi:hypothetical protein
MYAVYGLDETMESVETFIGYVPATFFIPFTEPSLWKVVTIKTPDGKPKIGRLCGRAFFVPALNLRADPQTVIQYMNPEAYEPRSRT